MKKKISIIVGGTGQFGICITKILLKKKIKVVLTTRNVKKAIKKFPFRNKNLKFIKLNIEDQNRINYLLKFYKPDKIFYFASQSSPSLSFKRKKETYVSNVVGCNNFLTSLHKYKSDCKFINATSSEIFSETKKKIDLTSEKKPISPYGVTKLISFNQTKFFREKKKINSYNAVIFNTESFYRDKNYLIPKICNAAINAFKYKKKTSFGNLNISREWNWCDEQSKYMIKFIEKKPQDFILSNGKSYTLKQMMNYSFGYFNLNYKDYIVTKKKFLRKKDFKEKKSAFYKCLRRNKIKRVSLVFGRKLINELIKHYLNEKKYK